MSDEHEPFTPFGGIWGRRKEGPARRAIQPPPFTIPTPSTAAWQHKSLFEYQGSRVIAWMSSDKGFEDITTELIYQEGAWHWAESEDPVKRPDLIKGVQKYPEPPVSPLSIPDIAIKFGWDGANDALSAAEFIQEELALLRRMRQAQE